MISQDGVIAPPTFLGNEEQQQLAKEIFQLMVMQGALFAVDAPIRQTRSNLVQFLAEQKQIDPDSLAAAIDAAILANPSVFAREEIEDDVVYITSRSGTYRPQTEDLSHMFKDRLYQPEKPLPIDDISVVVSTTRPALTTVEPVFISDYWQIQAGLVPVPRGVPTEGAEESESISAGQPSPETSLVSETPAFSASVEEAVVAEAAAEPEAVDAQESDLVAEPEVVRSATEIVVDGQVIDLAWPVEQLMASYGPLLERALLAAIDRDPLNQIVSFGRNVYPQASLVNLGKNDLRRIRDYILEVGEPLLDTTIIADLYYHNPRQADYEGFRFSLNYRLSREKDFDFVGVEGARLWSTKGLPIIGTKRVKASEMGQLTSYLEEGFDDSLESQSAEAIKESGSVSRLLTFFEWEYGVLPFDESLKALFPPLMLPDQRSAIFRIDVPQHYTSYLAEVRVPTGSRGGWLQGLEDFFREHLVPGALITLSRTEEPNVFVLQYEEAESSEDRLLTLDEKKNKLAFTNVTYYCVVDEDQLINQQRFGKLRNLKLFPMADRRKADLLLEHIFETVGDQLGNRSEPLYWIKLDDLYVAANVLRPFSKSYLRLLLNEDERYYADDSVADAYFYKPEQKPELLEEESYEEEIDDEEDYPSMRRGGRRFRDDDE